MNKKADETLLIDEAEVRLALRPLRPDPGIFAVGVQQHIDRKEWGAQSHFSTSARSLRSDWINAAAAVIPLPLLNPQSGIGIVKLSHLALGKKLVALSALPAIGLLIMFSATIWAVLGIRRAQFGQFDRPVDRQQLNRFMAAWWRRRFGLEMFLLSGALLIIFVTGNILPLLGLFAISGFSMVSLVIALGREGLLDRNSIGQACGPGLGFLAQLAFITTSFHAGQPFLDQMLVPAVFLLGSCAITMSCSNSSLISSGPLSRPIFVLFIGLFVICLSSSIWNPITTSDLKHFVESFDNAEFSSVSWDEWQVPAQWLNENNVPVNFSKPRELLGAELTKVRPDFNILCSAIEARLIQPSELDQLIGLSEAKNRLLNKQELRKPFVSIDSSKRFWIHALVLRDKLSEAEKDALSERLVATLEHLKTRPVGYMLAELRAITELAQLIKRPLEVDAHRLFVHEKLVEHQRLQYHFGSRNGGFARSERLNFSDEQATVDALILMQIYGVPDSVRIDALRSYLRPSWTDNLLNLQGRASVRASSIRRLESLPGVQAIGFLDYLEHEQNLILAVLLSSISLFATFGSPKTCLQKPG